MSSQEDAAIAAATIILRSAFISIELGLWATRGFVQIQLRISTEVSSTARFLKLIWYWLAYTKWTEQFSLIAQNYKQAGIAVDERVEDEQNLPKMSLTCRSAKSSHRGKPGRSAFMQRVLQSTW